MEDRKLKLVQVVTIIGETYTFENPTEEGYNSEVEQYYVNIGSDVTLFPREAVVAFRAVYEDATKNNNEENNEADSDTKILSILDKHLDKWWDPNEGEDDE